MLKTRQPTSSWLLVSLLATCFGLSRSSFSFDPSSYSNIHDAINGHPDLKEFAKLLEADGVRDIIKMNAIQLTVFAPIDSSLAELLAKSKTRPTINLIDLAKHHIAQGFITADDRSAKLPLKFSSFSLLSPLFLSQLTATTTTATGSRPKEETSYFVNNAKILATHLIPIANSTDQDQYQTLHIIDQPLEFAYINKRIPIGGQQIGDSQRRYKNVKLPLGLDDLQSADEQAQPAVHDFHERFGQDLGAGPQLDLYRARLFKGTSGGEWNQEPERVKYSRRELDIERLAKHFRQLPALSGKLYQLNDNSPLATYFLPVDSHELDKLLSESSSLQQLALEAHVIPDQVLFTRLMGLGQQRATLASRSPLAPKISLSLAKGLGGELPSVTGSASDEAQLSRRLLSAPLLLQASTGISQASETQLRPGLTSSEILVANIPIKNGVLHLIKRPILVSDTKLLDYLNDNDNQLSDMVQSLGSQSWDPSERAKLLAGLPRMDLESSSPVNQAASVKVNRFRELLARERQLLASLSSDGETGNRTILAPSDEAFARLRYDLRALVQNDESMIPRHWDAGYRQDLLERLVKRHVVDGQSLVSEQLLANPSLQLLTENGRALRFRLATSGSAAASILVECDDTQAKLVQRDLVASNGALHVIDRVLGEELETVDSLLRSMLLRHQVSLDNELGKQPGDTPAGLSLEHQLYQLVESNLRQETMISTSTSSSLVSNSIDQEKQQQVAMEHELQVVSKSIGQFIEELSSRHQLHHLSNSVNISYQLAKLTSLAEGLDDFNERFKSLDRQFTYFVPNDLAWLRLQQVKPELYKPLMYILDQQQATEQTRSLEPEHAQLTSGENSLQAKQLTPKSSPESSHRLRQILERHLIVNRRVAKRELNKLDSIQTLGATLKLVDSTSQQPNVDPLTAAAEGSQSSGQTSGSYAAALHSIHQAPPVATSNRLKSIRLGTTSADIVQVSEASNGVVYVIDSVLILPQDSDYIVQSSSSPAISSSVSSLLGAHNGAILDFIQGFLTPISMNGLSGTSILALIGTLTLAIAFLLIVTLMLVVRRRRQTKLHRHQQLESGLTSSSSANSGSTSTTKSL